MGHATEMEARRLGRRRHAQQRGAASSELRGRKGTDKTEAWAGEIVGPSLVGPGWWNVKRDTPSGTRRGTHVFAVPDSEIKPRKG
jgi:hypothetical protein